MDNSLIEQIRTYAKDVSTDVPLSTLTTMRTGGNAACLIKPDEQELIRVINIFAKVCEPYVVIGNGSNVVFEDKGYNGVVIVLGNNMSKVTVSGDMMEVSAGTLLSEAAVKAKEAGLSGLEFASGIPGTIGGAVFMNAGAYDHEMKDIVHSVRAVDRSGNVKVYEQNGLRFSYRSSRFSEGAFKESPCTPSEVILSVTLKLTPSDSLDIGRRMRELMEKRREKQPLEYPSAGSAFKRPEGHFAGKLIEDAGLKGRTIGGAAVSEKHAGFIINKGGATTDDIKKLINEIKDKVKELSGVELVPEIRFAGEPCLPSVSE